MEVDSPFTIGSCFRENKDVFSLADQAGLEFIHREPSRLAGSDDFGTFGQNLAVPIGRCVVDPVLENRSFLDLRERVARAFHGDTCAIVAGSIISNR